VRCAGCSRPLFMPPPTAPIRDVASLTDLYNASSDSNDISSTAVNNNDNNTVINIRNNSKFNTNNTTNNNKINNNTTDNNSNNNNNTNNDNNNSSDNRNKNNNSNNNENSLNNLQSNTPDKPIYVNHKSDAMGKIWGAVESGPGSSSLVVYLSKLAYHTACYEKIKYKK
jgi:hypothetical protein